MMHRVVTELEAIMDDPSARQIERDVARRVKADLDAGWTPCQDHLGVLHGYIQRQQRQDRFGK